MTAASSSSLEIDRLSHISPPKPSFGPAAHLGLGDLAGRSVAVLVWAGACVPRFVHFGYSRCLLGSCFRESEGADGASCSGQRLARRQLTDCSYRVAILTCITRGASLGLIPTEGVPRIRIRPP